MNLAPDPGRVLGESLKELCVSEKPLETLRSIRESQLQRIAPASIPLGLRSRFREFKRALDGLFDHPPDSTGDRETRVDPERFRSVLAEFVAIYGCLQSHHAPVISRRGFTERLLRSTPLRYRVRNRRQLGHREDPH